MDNPDDSLSGDPTLHNEPIAHSDLLIGTTLDGRYQIEKELGHGGFGTVYLASDARVVSRKVVVKVIHPDVTSHEWGKKKFRQELEGLGRLNHPSLVSVIDGGEIPDGRPYIVMQYIEGDSLRFLIPPEGMGFARVASIIRQIGKALTSAHQAGILHRDLKPENIMVQAGDDEHVKLIDFGVAKVKDSVIGVTTGQEMAVGTLAYMSPEQLNAKPVTPQSDIYALAVIAYEMLTGRRLQNPESAFQMLELQRSGVRLKPSDLRPGIPAAAESILLKGLSFEPEQRYERAREFADLLASALVGDDEETKISTQIRNKSIDKNPSLETAHVLFVDIVSYSLMLIDEQTGQLKELQDFVSATAECKRANAAGELISLPTGDGMALVFFEDPEAPVRCAVELSRALKKDSEIRLRMGIHSGLVYRMADIKNNMNVAGGGINIAQRVMDCGDGGHILLSNRVAEDLGQLARWSTYLHDLGEAEVKHGALVHVYNFHGDDFGNPQIPAKLQKKDTGKYPYLKIGVVSILAVVSLIAGLLWINSRRPIPTPPTETTKPETAATVPERSLTYWLTVQRMLNKKPLGEPYQSAGDVSFGNGWKFQFNVRPSEAGALYLLAVGPGKKRTDEYNVLFPLPIATKANANLTANQTYQSDWLVFVEQKGVERFWIIWSTHQIPELDAIFEHAATATRGEIVDDKEIARVESYLKNSSPADLQVIPDKASKLTSIKGRGEILVNLIELSHDF